MSKPGAVLEPFSSAGSLVSSEDGSQAPRPGQFPGAPDRMPRTDSTPLSQDSTGFSLLAHETAQRVDGKRRPSLVTHFIHKDSIRPTAPHCETHFLSPSTEPVNYEAGPLSVVPIHEPQDSGADVPADSDEEEYLSDPEIEKLKNVLGLGGCKLTAAQVVERAIVALEAKEKRLWALQALLDTSQMRLTDEVERSKCLKTKGLCDQA